MASAETVTAVVVVGAAGGAMPQLVSAAKLEQRSFSGSNFFCFLPPPGPGGGPTGAPLPVGAGALVVPGGLPVEPLSPVLAGASPVFWLEEEVEGVGAVVGAGAASSLYKE